MNSIHNSNNQCMSDYPEVFYTNRNNQNSNTYSNNCTCNKCSENNHYTYNNPINNMQGHTPMQNMGSMFNLDMVKNFLPLFSKKDASPDFSSILKNFNPQISKIFSSLGLGNLKKDKSKESESKAPIIDISEYNEVS